MKRIFVDCSFLVQHPHIRTGIQRVVRRLVEEIPRQLEGRSIQMILVRLDTGRVVVVHPESLRLKEFHNRWFAKFITSETCQLVLRASKVYLWGVANALLNLALMILPTHRSRQLLLSGLRKSRSVFRSISRMFSLTGGINPTQHPVVEPADLIFNSDDCLLMLDASWHISADTAIQKFKRAQAKVVYVVYDLIPILHPEFFEHRFALTFKNWMYNTSRYADGYLCISNAVKNDLGRYMQSHFQNRANTFTYGSFPLGCDFGISASQRAYPVESGVVPPSIAVLFRSAPTFLMVSTIEPRKNHTMVLDAFEKLWSLGHEVNLIVLGKVGWNVQGLMLRINCHPQLGKHLFVVHDASDELLKYCYASSTALVFASHMEGFGLPIVEALAHGLPVIASDIPCHREVGGDLITYFDLSDGQSLVSGLIDLKTQSEIIKTSLRAKVAGAGVVVPWSESAKRALAFCDTVMESKACGQTTSQ
ncbi:glycosyltransferase family 4 protein [Limnobacter parvus]|uniref:Glycosyltransferase family 4 protein n=1 Tax=Limnobacter parvus TaxID=2939690 RepID=A0ABT1XD83_9BURK|nr:glycosyltransferase family 1 protein [Limnobacter parvus]MCR2745238.1 glycosyltransferase family 4 protein [Limnobacter parvus]